MKATMSIAPPATGKDASFAIDIPNIEDMESYARNSQYSKENEVLAYPNPTQFLSISKS